MVRQYVPIGNEAHPVGYRPCPPRPCGATGHEVLANGEWGFGPCTLPEQHAGSHERLHHDGNTVLYQCFGFEGERQNPYAWLLPFSATANLDDRPIDKLPSDPPKPPPSRPDR